MSASPSSSFPSIKSPLTDAPVERDTRSIQDIFFAGVRPTRQGNFEVFADESVGHLFVQQLAIFEDENGNGIQDASETVYSNFNLSVFVSRDVSKLEDAFDKHVGGENDVCFYLEDNTGDIASGTTAWAARSGVGMVIVGDKVRDQIDDFFNRSNQSGFTAFKDLQDQLGISVDYTRKELKKLVTEGRSKTTGSTITIGIFQLFNGIHILAAPAYKALGSFITGATATVRSYIQFQSHHWDPEAKPPEGAEKDGDYRFSPVLLPVSYQTLEANSSGGIDAASSVAAQIRASLAGWESENSRYFKKLTNKWGAKVVVPKEMRDFLKRSEEYVAQVSQWVVSSVAEMTVWFSYLGSRWINALNAFYCGLWNGLVESVLGIVDLVGYLFMGLGAFGEAAGNAQELIPQILEAEDEFLQAIMNVDFGGVLADGFGYCMSSVSTLNPWAFTQYISIEKVAYFFGQLAGFVVEIFVSIFYSGGADGVRAAVLKFTTLFGSLGKNLTEVLAAGIRRTFGAISATLDSLLAVFRKLIELMKDARGNMKMLFQWLSDEMAGLAKLSSSMLDEVIQKFGFTADELKSFDELGLSLTNFSGDTCQACQVRV